MPDDLNTPDVTQQPAEPVVEESAPAPAPRRRRAAVKPAGAAVAPAPGEAPTEATEAEAPAPAKRVRKRVAAAPAEPATEPTAELGDPAPAPAAEEAAASPAPARRRRAPAVVAFQAPVEAEPELDAEVDLEEPAAEPRRRRRAGTAGAIAPAAFIAAEPLPADLDEGDGELPANDEDDEEDAEGAADRPRRRRRGGRGRSRRLAGESGSDDGDSDGESADGEAAAAEQGGEDDGDTEDDGAGGTRRRRRRRRRSGSGGLDDADDAPGTVVHVREPRAPRVRGASAADEDGVRGITGSTRMAAKRARRQEGRDSGRRRPPILSEAEFLARREAVERVMVVRQQGERTQIAVLEDGILVEHYVTKASAQSYAGNVYLGRVQNVLPSMEAAFVDIGKSRNAVLYAGEVNYDAQLAGHGPRKIESVLKGGQEILVQVTKDPIGHKGARLTSQISLPGRYLVYVPEGSMTGISRKLPEPERNRLKAILRSIVPEHAGVIIRTAAEGVSEEEIARDVRRLQAQWEVISTKAAKGGAPVLLHAEPDLVIRVVRDIFNEDFTRLIVQGDSEWDTIRDYVEFVAPDLSPRLERHSGDSDAFAAYRVDEQLAKALERKVFLPSGGSLVIDRTEAMVVIDVNTGKYVGKGGNLEETVTRNNLEAAEEVARQLRLRDLGGIIVVDFIDMVLESNRDLVVRRLVECLGRDRTKHQVAEVTSLGLVQMTRKRVGQGLLESFSTECEHCNGRGLIVHSEPVDQRPSNDRPERGDRRPRPQAPAAPAEPAADGDGGPKRRRRGGRGAGLAQPLEAAVPPEQELADLLAVPAGGDHAGEEADAADHAQPPAEEAVPAEAPAAATEAAAEDQADHLADQAEPGDATTPPRRRRRATSRPAGPPAIPV